MTERILPPPDTQQLVLWDTVRTGFAMTGPILAAQTVAGLVLFFAVRGDVPVQKLTFWAGYHVAMLIISAFLMRLGRGRAENPANTTTMARLLTLFAVLRSLSWALGAILFFPHLDFGGRCLILALLCALSIGAATTSIAFFPSFVAFVCAALIPLAILFILEPDTRSRWLGIGLLVGWLMILQSGRRLNHWLVDASRRKFELERTTEQLRFEQSQAETARAHAVAAQNESEVLRVSAERSSSDKTRFLAAASHDLRQPMHSLALFLEAARGRNQDREVDGLLQKVDQSVKSLDALFESLLDVSRLDSATVTPRRARFALAPLLSTLEARFAAEAAEKGLSLRVRGSDVWVLSDLALLERILANLVSNAIRYTTRGGVLVGVRTHGARARIEIWDTGEGIPEDKHEVIFQEFVQLSNPERDRRKGLGLGLAIVQRLGHLLDHPVALRSRPGVGTVFTVSVPMVRRPAATAEEIKPKPERAAQKIPSNAPVLLIDDEVESLEATMTALELMGCTVYPAARASDAIAAFTMMVVRGTPPVLIVSDYRLGADEGNGLELIAGLRAQAKQIIPAVLLTGDAMLFDAMGRDLPLPDRITVLSKPASSAQLLAAISKSLA